MHPRRSLVHNAGFDGSGTHCGAGGGSLDDQAAEVMRFRLGESTTFPTKVEEDREAFARITEHLRGGQQRVTERRRLEKGIASCDVANPGEHIKCR